MRSVKIALRRAAVPLALCVLALGIARADAESGFPFGMDMTLDGPPMPGSKHIPELEIDDNGDVVLQLWCKSGKGQFSVAGNTVVFIAGAMDDRDCSPDRAQADDELIAALTEATSWKWQGGAVSFIGSKTLRFHINSN